MSSDFSSSSSTGSKPIIRRRSATGRRRRDGLIQFARDNTSQNGEDGVIAKLFELLPSNEDGRRQCVDVGAWDGQHLSNTYSLLVKDDGKTTSTAPPTSASADPSSPGESVQWTGILIEADSERFQDLKALHAQSESICLNITVSSAKQSPDNLVAILRQHGPSVSLPDNFDFLCIDVDGSDYWLLNDIWAVGNYRPKVVCVEFNPTMPDDLIYIPERNDTVRHGASLSALVELANSYGYVLVETTLFNAFFVPEDLYQQYLQDLVPDTSIEALHEVTMGTSLYQLYDGTLKLFGCKKLLWHQIGMDEKKIQMLPESKRSFPFAPPETPLQDYHKLAVDMSAFCVDGGGGVETNDNQRACAAELVSILKSDGFCLIRGTGISQGLCQGALDCTNSFLQDADESVRRSCLTTDRARRGYSPMCTENFASLVGEEGPNDLVRKFRMGPATDPGSPTSSLLAPNVWPDSDSWEEGESARFQSTLTSFFDGVCHASHSVVQAICQGLIDSQPELEESISALSMKDSMSHTSILTLLGYRSGSRHKKGKKKKIHPLVAAHTDVGVITVLLFDQGDCATLQRKDIISEKAEESSWIDVTLPSRVPKDPIFVVNIADCLSDLSHGYLPSTLHRVVPCGGTVPRNCLALFVGLDPSANLLIEQEAMTYEEWRKRRIAKSQESLRRNGGANG